MKRTGWTTLGLSAGLIVATGLAFFLYVPVLVIGAAWLFGLAVVLCSGWGSGSDGRFELRLALRS